MSLSTTPRRHRPHIQDRAALRKDAIPRAKLAAALQRRVADLGLSRDEAGRRCGEAASQMSRLMCGHVTDFSADRIAKHLTSLGVHVVITLTVTDGKRGKVRVHDHTRGDV